MKSNALVTTVGSVMLTAAALSSSQATASMFSIDTLPSGYQQAPSEGKCGEGKCGGNKPSKVEKEGNCGEGKCGEGKCGAKKPSKVEKEGKCGEGKCGGKTPSKIEKEGKCGEGKCGAN